MTRMKIAYITVQSPWGKGEAFILEEMLEIKHQGYSLLILPRNPSGHIYHYRGKELQSSSVCLPVINLRIFIFFIYFSILSKKRMMKVILNIIKHSRNVHILLKNLLIAPKSVYLSKIIMNKKIEHIHAHWGATTATMAYVINQLTGIPWSFTLHRWDIYENNMLKEKARTASFVRCISKKGKTDLISIIGEEFNDKIKVIHVGVEVPLPQKENLDKTLRLGAQNKVFNIAVPASLLPVKGHKYIIEACSILLKKRVRRFKFVFYGDGPLKKTLKNFVKERKLDKYIEIHGMIPHEQLLSLYKERKIDLVVLPSISISCENHEGIPVALMEAMAYGIPVISTKTGSIPELISEGEGILVEQKNAKAIANAVEKLIKSEKLRRSIGMNGMLKIQKEFSLKNNVKLLTKLFKTYSVRENDY